MEKFSVKESYKAEIDKIWENEEFKSNIEVLKRGYAVHDIMIKNSILFIGINPSFSEGLEEISHFINIDEQQKLYPYFNKFKIISDKIGLNWTHYDLLFFRETKQKYIDGLLRNKVGIDFLYRQLELSKRIILEVKPKIIVVSNTMSRRFMGFEKSIENNTGIWMGFDFEFDENFGTHKVTNTELKDVPVFFTSMLTGQRALDNGSFERLIWHIKFVQKKLIEKKASQ